MRQILAELANVGPDFLNIGPDFLAELASFLAELANFLAYAAIHLIAEGAEGNGTTQDCNQFWCHVLTILLPLANGKAACPAKTDGISHSMVPTCAHGQQYLYYRIYTCLIHFVE